MHVDARWDGFHPNGTILRHLEEMKYDQPPFSERYPTLPGVMDDPRPPRGNRIERNILSYSRDDIGGFGTAREAAESAVSWHMVDFPTDLNVVDHNLIWHGGLPIRVEYKPYLDGNLTTITWDEWRAMGPDTHSIIADPGFVDPANDNYRLSDGSPAFDLGFERIPFGDIGPYEHELRASWPVDAQRRRGNVQKRTFSYTLYDLETEGPWHFPHEFEVVGTFPLEWDGGWNDGVPSPAPGFEREYGPELDMDPAADATYETSEGQVGWRTAARDETAYLDLRELFAETDNVIAYVRFSVYAEEETATRLSIGTNDGARIWFNGELMASEHTGRRAEPHQHVIPVVLHEGRNDVLLKVENFGGNWGVYAAVEDARRKLRFSAE